MKGGGVMGIKTNFNWKDLEKEIRRSVTNDLKAHPEQVLKQHIGETYDADCPQCGHTKVTIISPGKARCNSCKQIRNVSVDVSWR